MVFKMPFLRSKNMEASRNPNTTNTNPSKLLTPPPTHFDSKHPPETSLLPAKETDKKNKKSAVLELQFKIIAQLLTKNISDKELINALEIFMGWDIFENDDYSTLQSKIYQLHIEKEVINRRYGLVLKLQENANQFGESDDLFDAKKIEKIHNTHI